MLERKQPEVPDGHGDSRFDFMSKGAFATPGVLATFTEEEVRGILRELAGLAARGPCDYLQVFRYDDDGRVIWCFDQGSEGIVLCLPSEW